MERLIMQKPDDELDGFVHAWNSQLLLREAEAKGATAMPVVAPADRLETTPDAPAGNEDPDCLLPGTTWPFRGPRGSAMACEVEDLALQLHYNYMDSFDQGLQPSCSAALEYDFGFDLSPLSSLLPGARTLHTGDSRPPEVEAGDLRPPVAGAADHRVEQPLDPPAPHLRWPAASGRDSPGAPRHRHLPARPTRSPRPLKLGGRDKRKWAGEDQQRAKLVAAALSRGPPRQQRWDEPMPYDAELFALDDSIFNGYAAQQPWATERDDKTPLSDYVLERPGLADWRLRYGDVRAYDTQLGFSYLVARNLSPRDLASLGQCCVDWYDMCNDDYFRACLDTLFERVSRGDWCKAGLCSHGECVAFRKPARALTRAGPSGGGEKEDGWPREPDPSSLAEAHLDNKCAGGHDDHGDISFGLSLRQA